jgi:hypothetical protein
VRPGRSLALAYAPAPERPALRVAAPQGPEPEPAVEATAPVPAGFSFAAAPVAPPDGEGRPLDPPLRSFFEARLGADLAAVRIHDGDEAAAAARARGARAFTLGDDVFFAAGRYAPATPEGRWLLAHELAHVAQARRPGGEEGTDGVERDARAAASAVLAGAPVRLRARRSAAQPHLFGEPDATPDLTFVSTSGKPLFLAQAVQYHQTWGLKPQRFDSLQGLLGMLAQGSGTIGRLRIVSHADFDNLYTPLFDGGPAGITREDLLAWGESDVAGLRETLHGQLMKPKFAADVVAAAGAADPGPFQTLWVDPANPPTDGPVAQLIEASADLLGVRIATGLPDAQRAVLEAALSAELDGLRDAVQRDAGIGTAPDAAQHLQDAITGQKQFTAQFRAQPAPFVQAVGAATAGAAAGFRASLDVVRARLTSSSWIDIRGCRIGQKQDYLAAVAQFFGTGQTQPHVSGPDWFQSYPTIGTTPIDDSAVRAQAGRTDVKTALTHWAYVTGVGGRLMWWLRFLDEAVHAENVRTAAAVQAEPSPPSLLGGLHLELDPLELDVSIGGEPTATSLQPLEAPKLSFPLRRRPPVMGRKLEDPWAAFASRELPRYTGPDGLLRYYLEAGLPLPVQEAADPSQIRLLYKEALEHDALSAWLTSEWAPAAPGLAAILAGDLTLDSLRQVEAVLWRDASKRTTDMYVSPDPLYDAHIARTA